MSARGTRRPLYVEPLERRCLLAGINGPHDDDPGYDLVNFDIEATLSIFVDSQPVPIPEDIGVDGQGSAISFIRTSGEEGQLRLSDLGSTTPADFLTVGDFFETWRTNAGVVPNNVDAILSGTQLLDNVADDQHALRMFVNGSQTDALADYQFHDGDEVVLVYTSNPIATFETNVGAFVMEILADEVPNTVNNFLNYLNRDAYVGTAFHRVTDASSDAGFIVQGGGFVPQTLTTMNAADFEHVETDPPIGPEQSRSNTRGTVSMAMTNLGATSEWFVNVGDNTPLDSQGFTPFGLVLDMTAVDAIAALTTSDLAPGDPDSPLREVPYTDQGELPVILGVTGEGTVNGQVFDDIDGDGTLDAGESGLAGVRVFSDDNGNGQLDSDEPVASTDSGGNFSLRLPSGTRRIRSLPDEGLVDTSGAQLIDVTIGGTFNTQLGNRQALPTAVDDLDFVTTVNAALTLDVLANDDSGTVGGELTIASVGNPSNGGTASISTDRQSLSYTPRQGFIGSETFSYTIRNESGGTAMGNVTVRIEEAPTGSVSGHVFLDVNQSGIREAGELPIRNVVVNLSGPTSAGQSVTRSTTTDANGLYEFVGLAPGSYEVFQ
ncbi:MAG: peptidylprolyl isomerase, partial [Planctomycetota bacterium]